MSKKSFFILFIFAVSTGIAFGDLKSAVPPVINSLDDFQKNDRVLILSPHPDDETIACAGIIQQALQAGAKVKIGYLTNGEHNEYAFIVYEKRIVLRKKEFIRLGGVRKQEAVKAMKLFGLTENDLIFLGYPDFGTFAIFSQYWRTVKPYKSLLTRISSVPYKDNLSFNAPYVGESIVNDLERVLLEFKPNKIFVSHPADANVDHRALYLFLQIVLRRLDKQLSGPKVYAYLIHCVGWPKPRHYHPELSLEPPKRFLNSQMNWSKVELTPEQLEKKHQAILAYKSQTESSAFYLLSFGRKNEIFGDSPSIQLHRQVSLKEQAPLFFGFSSMFIYSQLGAMEDLENLIENSGLVSYAVVDDAILIRAEKMKGVNRKSRFLFYLFGYSDSVPFPDMPKIRIITKHNKFRVFNGRKTIKPEGISLDLNSNILILKVPLKILGNPNFILTSVKAYKGILPDEAMGFRRIEIEK